MQFKEKWLIAPKSMIIFYIDNLCNLTLIDQETSTVSYSLIKI